MKKILCVLATSIALGSATGCASFSTIDKAAPGTPKLYSGTRLNLHALSGNEYALRRFPVSPPRYPLLDLPFSFVADTVLLPLTMSVAAYEVVFE